MNKKKPRVSLIITVFNEAPSVPSVIADLNRTLLKMKDILMEVIFVDDGSNDNSLELIRHSQNKINCHWVRIIKLAKNFGAHAAIRAGIFYARGDYVTFFPCDAQYSFQLMCELVRICARGYDYVLAERSSTQSTLFENVTSQLYAFLMRLITGIDYPKRGFDIVLFNKKIKNELNKNVESNSVLALQILSLGFCGTRITCRREKRRAGKSKWTFGKKMKLFIDSLIAFSFAPIRFISFVGVLLSGIGFLWLMGVAWRAYMSHDLTPGWPSLLGVLIIGFGITNISLGIIAEYLWRTLDAARGRRPFVIDEISEFPHDKI